MKKLIKMLFIFLLSGVNVSMAEGPEVIVRRPEDVGGSGEPSGQSGPQNGEQPNEAVLVNAAKIDSSQKTSEEGSSQASVAKQQDQDQSSVSFDATDGEEKGFEEDDEDDEALLKELADKQSGDGNEVTDEEADAITQQLQVKQSQSQFLKELQSKVTVDGDNGLTSSDTTSTDNSPATAADFTTTPVDVAPEKTPTLLEKTKQSMSDTFNSWFEKAQDLLFKFTGNSKKAESSYSTLNLSFKKTQIELNQELDNPMNITRKDYSRIPGAKTNAIESFRAHSAAAKRVKLSEFVTELTYADKNNFLSQATEPQLPAKATFNQKIEYAEQLKTLVVKSPESYQRVKYLFDKTRDSISNSSLNNKDTLLSQFDKTWAKAEQTSALEAYSKAVDSAYIANLARVTAKDPTLQNAAQKAFDAKVAEIKNRLNFTDGKDRTGKNPGKNNTQDFATQKYIKQLTDEFNAALKAEKAKTPEPITLAPELPGSSESGSANSVDKSTDATGADGLEEKQPTQQAKVRAKTAKDAVKEQRTQKVTFVSSGSDHSALDLLNGFTPADWDNEISSLFTQLKKQSQDKTILDYFMKHNMTEAAQKVVNEGQAENYVASLKAWKAKNPNNNFADVMYKKVTNALNDKIVLSENTAANKETLENIQSIWNAPAKKSFVSGLFSS